MRGRYEEFGTGWLLVVGATGFALAFLLAKMKVLNNENVTKFTGVASGLLAAVMALSADGVADGFTGWMGRAAIFALVWFAAGLVLTFGAMIGLDKAESKTKGKS